MDVLIWERQPVSSKLEQVVNHVHRLPAQVLNHPSPSPQSTPRYQTTHLRCRIDRAARRVGRWVL
ncbi:hypothetical protein ILP97_00035 [Amycolatopsis sp. H6(2020)]|nr:hypothetical protein [Amycolatopsis sp. H6(2020)]